MIFEKYDKRAKKENILHLLKQFNLRVLNYVDVSIKIILWIWKEDSTSRKDEQLSSSEKEQSRKKNLLFWGILSSEEDKMIRNLIYDFWKKNRIHFRRKITNGH